MFVPQFEETALHPQTAFPVRTVGSTPRHGAQKEWIDFNNLLYGTTGNVGTHGRTTIDTNNDATVEFEG